MHYGIRLGDDIIDKKILAPVLTGLCSVAAVTAITVYQDRYDEKAAVEAAVLPVSETLYEVIEMPSSETSAVENTEEVSETKLSASSDEIISVVINANSKCFHADQECSRAKKISEENLLIISDKTVSELAAEGYWACSSCSEQYSEIAPKP